MKGWHHLLVLSTVLAAAPVPNPPLPVPPTPPPRSSADEPAPVPNRDAVPPLPPDRSGPTLRPTLLRLPTYQNQFDPSQGYISGSRLEEDQSDRKFTPSPGFSLEIPLH